MTQDSFQIAFMALCVTFDKKDSVKELTQIYFATLEEAGFSDEDMRRACKLVIASNKYMPKPAELIEAIAPTPDEIAELKYKNQKARQLEHDKSFNKDELPPEIQDEINKLHQKFKGGMG